MIDLQGNKKKSYIKTERSGWKWKADAIIRGKRDQPIGRNKQYNIPAINTCNERGVNDEHRGKRKEERKRENKKQNDFREGDVGNNYEDFDMYLKTWLSYKEEEASRETERGRRGAK